MADFKSGLRGTSVHERVPPNLMISLSKAITDAEIQAAADYFAGLKPRVTLRVIETDSVPKTYIAGLFLADANTGEKEPIGERITEVPEDLHRFENRDARSRFIVYAPIGSIERGKARSAVGTVVKSSWGALPAPWRSGLAPAPALRSRRNRAVA